MPNLVSEIPHRKTSTESFPYLTVFQLNLNICHCCSSFSPETNQNWFKHELQWCINCHVLKKHGAVTLETLETKFKFICHSLINHQLLNFFFKVNPFYYFVFLPFSLLLLSLFKLYLLLSFMKVLLLLQYVTLIFTYKLPIKTRILYSQIRNSQNKWNDFLLLLIT